MKTTRSCTAIVVTLLILSPGSQPPYQHSDPLVFNFDKKYGQVEVGGRYAGVEFHESRPFPSRISFYYPVANSIDLSTDYWKRQASKPLALGIRVGEGEKRWMGESGWEYSLSPHTVTFSSRDEQLESKATYEFCLNEPALVFCFTVKNVTESELPVEVYTHLILSLRTSHTFTRKDSAWTTYDEERNAIIAHFDDPQTRNASVFVQNVGASPREWTSSTAELNATDSGTSEWISPHWRRLGEKTTDQENMGRPLAAFIFRDTLQPGDSLSIVQVIGSCGREEVDRRTARLASSWHKEVEAYNQFMRTKAESESHFQTGDQWLDRSATWARGLLASNAHHLDGKILPMPCPAEYNFFFTHDMLLTDLAAVNFDLQRVKKDLLYLASQSEENIIPHAYYWKDDGFKKEICAPDNWNHLWFLIVSAGYVRHSLDDSTARALYPLLSKSVEQVLLQKKADGLVYARHPDWWDIGNVEGPRAYLTILTARALKEYLFVSAFLGMYSEGLKKLEATAQEMQEALVQRLWDDESQYLINYNGKDVDRHYYVGSLLGAAFGVLESEKSELLVETASHRLADRQIGVRTVDPADFHLDSVITYFRIAGNEAGDKYFYINGGVWTQGTASYILALKATGRIDEAASFLRATMSLDGIANSPMGQPAMYEYRYADATSPEYGKIDKPSFLWAGGFYLLSLYRLYAVDENVWNLSVPAERPSGFDSTDCSFAFGSSREALIVGKGNRLISLTAEGKEFPSRVLPLEAARQKRWVARFGKPLAPYLESLNAILHDVRYDETQKTLECVLSSFQGHGVTARVIGLSKPRTVLLDGRDVSGVQTQQLPDGVFHTSIHFKGTDARQTLTISLD